MALGGDNPVREIQQTESGVVVGFSARELLKFDPAKPTVVEHIDFPETIDEHLASKRGDRALLRFGMRVELWSTREFRRIAVLMTQPEPGPLQLAMSQDGSISTLRTCEERFRVPTVTPVGKTGKPAAIDEDDLPCGYVSFDAQGKETGRIASPTKDVSQFDLSPDGKYVVEYGLQLRNLLLRESGKQVLKRVGGRVDGGARSSEELMEFQGDRLLLSRFGLVEYDDLSTGKVISSQRYAAESPDEPIIHVRLSDAPVVASLWPSKARLFLYSFERAGTPAKVVSLNKVFTQGCLGCSMEADGDGVLISDSERTVHVSRVGAMTERPASKVSTTLAAGPSGRVVESYDDQGQRCAWVPAGADRSKATELPRSMCLSVSIGKGVLAANPAGGLHVWEFNSQKLTLEYGGGAESHGTLLVDNDVAGFIGHDGKPLWLTRDPPPKTPAVEDIKHFNRAARTQTHVFTLERSEKSTWIVARDKDDKEVMREDIGGQVASVYLHASGPRIAVPRWSSRGAEAVICEVGKGCSAMLASGAPFGLIDHWLLWRTGTRVEIVDLRTRDAVVLPEDKCTVPVGASNVAGSPRFVCMHHARPKGEIETMLWSFDSSGKPITSVKVTDAQGRASMPTKKTKGGWGDLWFEQSGVRWIHGKMLVPALRRRSTALFDLERGRLADVYVDGTGAVVTFADGSFERFGTSNGDARFRCRRGAFSYPLATCGAREVTGRWAALLQGP
jgi:hypothetical protein